MKKSSAALLLVVGLFAAWIPDVPGVAPAPPAPAPPRAPVAAAPPAAQHEVTVTVTGPRGSVFRVTGAVFGNTGLVDMPDAGTDSASFTTQDTGNLGLSVSVMPGPTPRTCTIAVDGNAVATGTADGDDNPVTCTATRLV
jgi:hypothetical protein